MVQQNGTFLNWLPYAWVTFRLHEIALNWSKKFAYSLLNTSSYEPGLRFTDWLSLDKNLMS